MGGRIVVGVDGSEEAERALRWALDEARLRGATLEVVHSWNIPYIGDLSGIAVADLSANLEQGARDLVDSVLRDTVGDEAGVAVDARIAEGPPAAVLLEAARGADLLVVGSRGRGGFTGLLLGSVSQACTQHAPCPVVVVPAQAEGAAESREDRSPTSPG